MRDADGNARIVQSSQPSAVKGGVVGAAAGGLLALLGADWSAPRAWWLARASAPRPGHAWTRAFRMPS